MSMPACCIRSRRAGVATKTDAARYRRYRRNISTVTTMPYLYCLRYSIQAPENRKAQKLNLLRPVCFI